eukprot:15340024-Ditylum_brightwellii.AAC.1
MAPLCMLADVAANTDIHTDYSSTLWESPTVPAIEQSTKSMLCHLLGTQSLPHYAFNVATIQESKGGLGMYDPTRNAIASFVAPLARIIQYALYGDVGKHKVPLSSFN